MKNLIDRIWDCIVAGSEVVLKNSDDLGQKEVKINTSKEVRKNFEKTFSSIYNEISLGYMKNEKEALDRHKVAAIIMISIIRNPIIQSKDETKCKGTFLGNYSFATDCGFSYMLTELNNKLRSNGEKSVVNFYFPEAQACSTDYYNIFYRNLYFANNNEKWGLNPLDIAERLFLLEYITLEKSEIDPNILKQY